ncbi:hypothetical protein [Microbacterium gorillae]|uniref:hypothetical protein n=1 Tax=Microbacterium gorillae TaxID=1231063 RepID=UPI00058B2323|nr:hypothetical protein [Microbacterium gorillae]
MSDEPVVEDAHELRRCDACARTAIADAAAVWRAHERRDAAELVHIAMEALLSGHADDHVIALAGVTGDDLISEIEAYTAAVVGTDAPDPVACAAGHARRYVGGRVRATGAMAAEVFLGDVLEDADWSAPSQLASFAALWDDPDAAPEASIAAARALLRSRCPAGVCEF